LRELQACQREPRHHAAHARTERAEDNGGRKPATFAAPG
jgi:hypothetical protein